QGGPTCRHQASELVRIDPAGAALPRPIGVIPPAKLKSMEVITPGISLDQAISVLRRWFGGSSHEASQDGQAAASRSKCAEKIGEQRGRHQKGQNQGAGNYATWRCGRFPPLRRAQTPT